MTFTSSVCACVSNSGFLRELLLPLLHFLRGEKSLPDVLSPKKLGYDQELESESRKNEEEDCLE